jgi:hypothetical protein
MIRTFTRDCPCCGATFTAKHQAAKWCSSRCAMRAYQRRRRGAPEADPGVCQVVQPVILDDDDLPYPWNQEPAAGLDCRTWQGTAIERRQADGFVNATQMAKANGKHLPHYMANERTQAYIAALAPVVGIPTTELVSVRQGGQPHLQGTWIHPRLAIDLARWISPAFAVWMDGWFLESLTQPQPATQQLSNGVHVIADNPQQAAWLWATAVEAEVSAALSRSTIAGRRLHPVPTHYQLHLLQA